MADLRIASFNVENLFARAKALNTDSWAAGRPVLAAQAEVNQLFELPSYDQPTKARILTLLTTLGVERSDESGFVRLRKIRGQLLRRPRTGPVQVMADGRPDWIGWVELKTEPVDELAMQHTAMVIRDVNADVLGVVEADSRPALKTFTEALLAEVDGRPFEQVMLIDGNDDRGIDVGLLTRPPYGLRFLRSHIFDTDADGVIFSRDCCEYHLDTPDSAGLVILVNHLKSKGYSTPGDPQGAKRRLRQATRVAAIYQQLQADGATQVAVIGDFNDDPTSTALQPLLAGTDLRDISNHPNFDFGPRQGTYGGGGAKDKIDYILLSPELFTKATGGAVFRKGVWHGPRVRNPWPMYDTLTQEVHAASDHAAIYADITL
jgi:endonuclease/exonuclease/phosphatase family metal-dependent hydrolase